MKITSALIVAALVAGPLGLAGCVIDDGHGRHYRGEREGEGHRRHEHRDNSENSDCDRYGHHRGTNVECDYRDDGERHHRDD